MVVNPLKKSLMHFKMKSILFFIAVIFSLPAFAQIDTSAPYYKEKKLPAFSLIDKDSVTFNQDSIIKGRKTIVMLFNPGCDHCQQQLDLLLSLYEVSQCNLVMSSIESIEKNKNFYEKNRLDKYSFVRLGKDYKYFFGKYFAPVKTIPVLAYYNEKNEFITISYGNTNKTEILKALGNQ